MEFRKQIIGFFLVPIIIVSLIMAACAKPAPAPPPVERWKPEQPIHIICTADPGSTYDIQARLFASEMTQTLDQPVVVDNVPGGGMRTGVTQAYRAKPDGYTLVYTSSFALVTGQQIYEADFDYTKFVYLAQSYDAIKGGTGVYATPGKDLETWEDIMKLERTLRWANIGPGSVQHVQAIRYRRAFKLNLIAVPGYAGADQFPAVARGEVDFAHMPLRYAEKWRGTVNVVLVESIGPFEKELGDVPTVAELGHPELGAYAVVHVVMAPPGTPERIASVLGEAAYAAAKSDAMKELHIKSIAAGAAWAPGDGKTAQASVDTLWKIIEEIAPELLEAKS